MHCRKVAMMNALSRCYLRNAIARSCRGLSPQIQMIDFPGAFKRDASICCAGGRRRSTDTIQSENKAFSSRSNTPQLRRLQRDKSRRRLDSGEWGRIGRPAIVPVENLHDITAIQLNPNSRYHHSVCFKSVVGKSLDETNGTVQRTCLRSEGCILAKPLGEVNTIQRIILSTEG